MGLRQILQYSSTCESPGAPWQHASGIVKTSIVDLMRKKAAKDGVDFTVADIVWEESRTSDELVITGTVAAVPIAN